MIGGLAAIALSIPLYFESNRGQEAPDVRYLAHTQAYVLLLSDTAVTLKFDTGATLRMNLPPCIPRAEDNLPGKTIYYDGLAHRLGKPMCLILGAFGTGRCLRAWIS